MAVRDAKALEALDFFLRGSARKIAQGLITGIDDIIAKEMYAPKDHAGGRDDQESISQERRGRHYLNSLQLELCVLLTKTNENLDVEYDFVAAMKHVMEVNRKVLTFLGYPSEWINVDMDRCLNGTLRTSVINMAAMVQCSIITALSLENLYKGYHEKITDQADLNKNYRDSETVHAIYGLSVEALVIANGANIDNGEVYDFADHWGQLKDVICKFHALSE